MTWADMRRRSERLGGCHIRGLPPNASAALHDASQAQHHQRRAHRRQAGGGGGPQAGVPERRQELYGGGGLGAMAGLLQQMGTILQEH